MTDGMGNRIAVSQPRDIFVPLRFLLSCHWRRTAEIPSFNTSERKGTTAVWYGYRPFTLEPSIRRPCREHEGIVTGDEVACHIKTNKLRGPEQIEPP